MASQVLSGTGNVSYTNNTGQNVRVVINYMSSTISRNADKNGPAIVGGLMNIGWGSSGSVVASSTNVLAIGRNLAFSAGVYSPTGHTVANLAISSNNMVMIDQSSSQYAPSELTNTALPTEIMLASGHIFSATCGSYNIVVIPEAG